MKTSTLLILATLATLTATASAASNQPDTSVLVLPTYVVSAPRPEPVELQIALRSDALRQEALLQGNVVSGLDTPRADSARPVKVANHQDMPPAGSAAKS